MAGDRRGGIQTQRLIANLMDKIAFQGEYGANSDMACRDMYPNLTPLPCRTFEDAFNAVSHGEADLAMIPIENTIAGRVADIHLLLPESQLYIVAENFMPIRFQLMVLPGTKAEQIKTVYSHIHVCLMFVTCQQRFIKPWVVLRLMVST